MQTLASRNRRWLYGDQAITPHICYNIVVNGADLHWLERPSSSDFIASVWACYAPGKTTRPILPDPCISIALVREGQGLHVAIHGPETKAHSESLTSGYSCLAIRLRPGALLQDFPTQKFVDKSLKLPVDDTWRFWFGGDQLQFPNFTTAERLVDRLCDLGYLQHGGMRSARDVSSRSHARLVKRTTGLSPHKLRQLERIHQALRLLKEGVSAATVAAELDFFDQSHLTHSSKQLLGYTPMQLKNLPHVPQVS